jgi:CRISPR-associated endoribonuclease Cas6
VRFEFCRLRFRFQSLERIEFPESGAGNVLRGAFGMVLREAVPGVYERLFAPRAAGRRPSGLSDLPRPFVFRAAQLNGCTLAPEASFSLDVHVFDRSPEVVGAFSDVFRQLATEGIGPARGRAILLGTENLDAGGVCSLSLDPESTKISRLRIAFLTPTELKAEGQLADRPEFGILMSRVRDRISTLSALYGSGALPIDFAAFGRRAAEVNLVQCEIEQKDVSRFSSRTRQRHSIGGFTGFAQYEGDLTVFLPFLITAQYTGIGRHTTWGNGEIRVSAEA